jgi:hypothetical protein
MIRIARTYGMAAVTIDVRHLFHCLALDAAVSAGGRCHAGTDGVRALLAFSSGHF